MKKYMITSIVYALIALCGGVFYREFTKFNAFEGTTTLSVIHTNYFVLAINFIPFRMDVDTLKANLTLTKPLTEHDKTNLSLLSKKVNDPKIKETIDYMILNNIKLEQESID